MGEAMAPDVHGCMQASNYDVIDSCSGRLVQRMTINLDFVRHHQHASSCPCSQDLRALVSSWLLYKFAFNAFQNAEANVIRFHISSLCGDEQERKKRQSTHFYIPYPISSIKVPIAFATASWPLEFISLHVIVEKIDRMIEQTSCRLTDSPSSLRWTSQQQQCPAPLLATHDCFSLTHIDDAKKIKNRFMFSGTVSTARQGVACCSSGRRRRMQWRKTIGTMEEGMMQD